jgi:hypothetical protein
MHVIMIYNIKRLCIRNCFYDLDDHNVRFINKKLGGISDLFLCMNVYISM